MNVNALSASNRKILGPIGRLHFLGITLLTIQLISALAQNAYVAGVAFTFLLALIFVIRSFSTSNFQAVFEIVFGALIFGYLNQIGGEILGGWVTSTVSVTLLLTAVTVPILNRTTPNIFGVAQLTKFFTIATFLGSVFLCVMTLSVETSINFLGYGYDNAAHIAQAHLILQAKGTTFLNGDLPISPEFLQDSAQASTAFIATLTRMFGIPFSNTRQILAAYMLTTLMIPFLAIISPALIVAVKKSQKLVLLIILISSSMIFGTGYLSRIWFSGFLASNLGTLLLVLLVITVVSKTFTNPAMPLLAAVTIAHVYPLYTLVALTFCIIQIFKIVRLIINKDLDLKSIILTRVSVLILVLSVLLILPISATRRSYGGSHFLVDGGIEPIPLLFLGIWCLLFIVGTTLVISISSHKYELLLILLFSTTIAVTVCIYSLRELDRISYYPTKITITLIICLIAATWVSVFRYQKPRKHRQILVALIFGATISNLFFNPQPKIFINAYMGEADTVLRQTIRALPEVVEPTLVKFLLGVSETYNKPVLLVSTSYESELNTRWINTLSGHWNDSSWTDWITARELIGKQMWWEASQYLLNSDLIIAFENVDDFDSLFLFKATDLCLISSDLRCEFPYL